jgi:hypothetical protein
MISEIPSPGVDSFAAADGTSQVPRVQPPLSIVRRRMTQHNLLISGLEARFRPN